MDKVCKLLLSALLLCSAVQAAEPIVIGQSLPLQIADVDGRGEQAQAGALALVEAVNARGGVGGRVLQLVTLNNEGDPVRHRRNLRALAAQHKAVAWINCIGDADCAIAAAEAEALGMPLVGVHSGLSALTRARAPHVFRVRPGHAREAQAVARQLKALAVVSAALVSDRPEADEAVQAMQAALAQESVQATVLRLGEGAPASSQMLKRLGEGRHGAAVLLVGGATLSQIVERKDDQREEWPLLVFALSNGTLSAAWGSFPQRLIGYTMVVPNPDRGTLALTRDLQQAAERWGGPVATSATGLEAYISARLVAEALRRSGARIDAASLFGVLDTMGEIDLGGMRLDLSRQRASASDSIDLAVRPKLKPR